ncbi:MAG: chromate transporter [Clostridia bacterium]|nr:chromate transporter [Clostridia bacterium]
MTEVSLLTLFFTFFKIGLFTFGGGYAMLPFIQQEVMQNNWLEEATFVNFVGISESSPGPFAINIATFIGMEKGGWLGSALATLGVVLPSFIVILIVAQFYLKFKESRIVSGVMSGLKPAAVGLIAAAVITMVIEVLFPAGFSWNLFAGAQIYVSLAIFALGLWLLLKMKKHPIFIICVSAVLGIAAGYIFGL